MSEQPKVKEIIIDCPPGNPRPDFYLELALKDTGIEPINTESRFFGEWIWNFTEHVSDDVWQKKRGLIFNRLTNYYNNGKIRFASVSD